MSKTSVKIHDSLVELQWLKIDGLPNIIRSKYTWLSIIWTIVLVTLGSICVWLISQTFVQYMTRSVSTTIRTIRDAQPPFPTITICNSNPFNTDYAAKMLANENITYLKGDPLSNYFAFLQLNLTKDDMRKMSSLELISCAFENEACSLTDFEYIFHPYLLSCYRFNADGSKHASLSGIMNSLSVQLYVGLPNYISSMVIQNSAIVFIQNSTDYPLSPYTTFTSVSPGIAVSFIPKRNIYEQYPAPYSSCTVLEDNKLLSGYEPADRTLFDAVVATGYPYSQSTCILFCQQTLTARACGCYMSFIEYEVTGYPLCGLFKDVVCALNFFGNFSQSSIIKDECLSNCPLECDSSLLEISTSSSVYPTRRTVEKIKKQAFAVAKYGNQTDFTENLDESLLQITVFYSTMAYTLVEEEPKMSLEDLIGALGGHSHLFMGMSLMSFLELFEFCTLFCFSMWKKKRSPKPFVGKL